MFDRDPAAAPVYVAAGALQRTKNLIDDRKIKGLGFTRAAIALAKTDGDERMARDYSDRAWGPESAASHFLRAKSAVAAANMDAANYAANIAEQVGYEFVGLVNEQSAVGRIQPRPAPLSTRLAGMSTGATGYWRGQAKPAPVTSAVFTNDALQPLGVVSLAVVTKELLNFGTPNGELWIRDELIRAAVQRLDTTFLSADAAVADVSPAGILSGVTPLTASSSTAQNVAYDLRRLMNDFTGDLSRSTVIMRPAIAAAVQSFEHPAIGANGGELLGLPVVTTRYAPDETVILVDASGIALGDDGVDVRIAEHATVEMLNASLVQDGTDGTGAQMVSLWQADLVGIMVNRRMDWAKMRPCVSYIDSVEYRKTSA